VRAVRELWKDKGRGIVKSADWSKSEGLLMFRGKIYVPKQRSEVSNCGATSRYVCCHAGHFKTLEMVSRNYRW
jgi:hypothetical protein